MPACLELASLSDALRDLETASGETLSEQAMSVLKKELVDRLRKLADLVDADTAATIRLRAEALEGEAAHSDTSRQIATEYTAAPFLEVLCGPLCTWRPKTRRPFHSFIAAARHQPSEQMITALNASFQSALGEVRNEIALPNLTVDVVHPMTTTDLIACGGEANTHPKHFAYFLPEDEGVDGVPLATQRTLAFRNVYNARYGLITLPLAKALLSGPQLAEDVERDSALLMWLRAHDLGHGVRLPATNYEWMGDLGVEPFMMLQEALADVYGFLLATTARWREIAGITVSEVCAAFLAESLHYLRRGPWFHGDSGAAYLELGYLAQGGHLIIRPSGHIEWTVDGLCEGLRQLAILLADMLLAAKDERFAGDLVQRHAWPTRTPALSTLIAVRENLTEVPTTLAYSRSFPTPADETQPSDLTQIIAAPLAGLS